MSADLLRVTAVMMLVQAMGSLAVFGAGVLAADVASEVQIPATRIGLFNAIVYVFAMCSGALTAIVQDRSGPVTVLMLSLGALLVGLVAAQAGHWLVLIGVAMAFGVAYGPMNPATSQILADITPANWRTFVFSLKQTGVTLGGALAGVLLPSILVASGWRAALWLQVVIVIVVMLLLWPQVSRFDRRESQDRPADRSQWRESMKLVGASPVLRCLASTSFIFAGLQISVGAFFVLYAIASLDVDLITAGYLFSMMQVGGIIGRLFWGYVASRLLRPVDTLLLITLISCLMLTLLVLSQPHWPLVAMMFLSFILGSTCYGWNGVVLSEIARFAPNGRVTDAVGAVQFVFFAGVVVLPPLFGQIVESTESYRIAFMTLVTVGLCAMLVLLWNRRLLADGDPEPSTSQG